MENKTDYDINWKQNWDEKIGMWYEDSGHTPPVKNLKRVHSARTASNLLLLAAQAGQLQKIDATLVLKRLKELQIRDNSEFHGYIKWFWEEDYPVDSNSPFFAGLPLIVLWSVYGKSLEQEQKKLVLDIFENLYIWFKNEVISRPWFYPNKALGDVVCAWLIYEACSKSNPSISGDRKLLVSLFHEGADYLSETRWGWGEHLSNIYSRVCLDELSLLLMLAKTLPENLRLKYKKLFEKLLELEDLYEKGPRVPAIRSYDFLNVGKTFSYRDTVKPMPSKIDIQSKSSFLGHTLYKLGWHSFAPPKKKPKTQITTECYNGAVASAYIGRNIRAGAISEFPFMPSIERLTCGLSWQSMPVAVSRPDKTWMYLQWETEERGMVMSHPAENVKEASKNYSLTKNVNPPILGKTYSLQKGHSIIVLRLMPQISQSWDRVTDRLRVVGEKGSVAEVIGKNGYNHLSLSWDTENLSVCCFPLFFKACDKNGMIKNCDSFCVKTTSPPIKTPVTKLSYFNEKVDWELSYISDHLEGKRMVATLWAFSLKEPITAPPVITRIFSSPALPRAFDEKPIRIKWEWKGVTWDILIDVLSDNPLKEYGKRK